MNKAKNVKKAEFHEKMFSKFFFGKTTSVSNFRKNLAFFIPNFFAKYSHFSRNLSFLISRKFDIFLQNRLKRKFSHLSRANEMRKKCKNFAKNFSFLAQTLIQSRFGLNLNQGTEYTGTPNSDIRKLCTVSWGRNVNKPSAPTEIELKGLKALM